MPELSSYDVLVDKLDTFIRKYYINKIIRGSLYAVALIIGLFLLFSLLEHQFFFGKGVRKLFFFGFIGTFLFALSYWVIAPILKYFRLGKTIDHEQAASIIGNHFTDVQDKLLNILHLKRQSESMADTTLIEASIAQKTTKLSPIPFKNAIDLRENKKYLRYALPPFLLFLVLLFAAPSLIKDSTNRIINNNKEFERAAPFHYVVNADDLKVVQYEDYKLQVKIEGEYVPEEVFIKQGDFSYRLKKQGQDLFEYDFKNVQKDIDFQLYSGRVESESYTLDALDKPSLTDFELSLDYPRYVQRSDEIIQNVGDITVPEGTKIKWTFEADHTDRIDLKFSGSSEEKEAKRQGETNYHFDRTARRDEYYKLFLANNLIDTRDSISYSISVVKDKIPTISAEQFIDSLSKNLYFFVGSSADDYGLSKLQFNYRISREDGRAEEEVKIPIGIDKTRAEDFSYTFDIEELGLNPGDNVSYYFQVFDNDGFNGPKSAKTAVQSFRKPTIEEYEEKEDQNEEEIKEKLKETKEKSREIREEFKKMREKLRQEKELEWEDKKDIEKLLEEQKKLREELEKAKEKFEENRENEEEFKEEKPELQEKQEKLQELFEEVLDEETKELMEKIEELMQELNKDNAMEMMEQMEMDDKEMEQELDRLLELYKQLEMEKEISEQIEKLEELAEKQEKLSEETKNEEKSNEELQKEQEKLNEEFEKLKEKQEELEKKNEELSPPKDMGDKEENEEQMEEISEDMEESQESLEQQDSQKASESQKKASEKMKGMAGKMQQSMESGEMEQMEEDMAALRQLLENLVSMSFDQESLIEDVQTTNTTVPRYVELVQTQFRLKDDFALIADSLHALSLRQDKIEAFVTEKVNEVEGSIKESLTRLEDRVKNEAILNQRETLKNVNDLALMLSEAMNQMQQQMSGMMSGSQMCNKPGKGKSGKSGKMPMDKITEGQEGLKKDLEKMKEGMEKGKDGKGGMSKEFAKAAARQAALRKALEGLNDEKKEQGKGSKELQELIDQMDKVETELVNKRLNAEMMKRQQDIITRLLKAENAERQQEYDNKRKAEQGRDQKRKLPLALQEYLKKREDEIDLYKSVSPELRPYYRALVKQYYESLKADK